MATRDGRNPERWQVSTPTDREITMRRAFRCLASLIFDAFTRPELLKRWFYGPPGGTLAVCMKLHEKPRSFSLRVARRGWKRDREYGVCRDFVAPELLVATEKFDQPWYPGEAVGTIHLAEHDGKTILTQTILCMNRGKSRHRPKNSNGARCRDGLRPVRRVATTTQGRGGRWWRKGGVQLNERVVVHEMLAEAFSLSSPVFFWEFFLVSAPTSP